MKDDKTSKKELEGLDAIEDTELVRVEDEIEEPDDEEMDEEVEAEEEEIDGDEDDGDEDNGEDSEDEDEEEEDGGETEEEDDDEDEIEDKDMEEDEEKKKEDEKAEEEKEEEDEKAEEEADAAIESDLHEEIVTDGAEKKKTWVTVVIVIVAAIIGVVAYFMLRGSGGSGNNNTQKSSEPAKTEVNQLEKLKLSGNELSDFDLAFMQQENKAENKIYSPLSIKYALGMIQEAAGGQTKTEIDTLIGNYQPKAYINNENRSLANAMFVRDEFKDNVKSSYMDKIKALYNASVQFDSFANASAINNWVSDQTLGIITNLLDDNATDGMNFALINALAIDMNWNYLIQCAATNGNTGITCKDGVYDVRYSHENYEKLITYIMDEKYPDLTFNDKENTKSVEIGASLNNYDIIKELGEEKIRSTVKAEYEAWLANEETKDYISKNPNDKIETNVDKYLDKYMEELGQNYGQSRVSTDFYINDGESEKVFAKDLKEYDGATLQYVGIMPKEGSLEQYIEKLNAEKAKSLIDGLKSIELKNFKDGVVTNITGKIPLFNYDYDLDIEEDLKKLGIKELFDGNRANLTNMLEEGVKVDAFKMKHKADIDFSNEGIKAAAVTMGTGMGAGGYGFEYKWDVPVETIDMTFDRPFLFLIRDKDTGEVWFAGTVYEGTANN